MKYLALAFYRFVTLDNPHLEIKKHKDFFKNKELTGRIYISTGGINAQMSGTQEAIKAYLEWIRADVRFADQYFNIQPCDEQVFPKMTVKYRRQLAALDEEVDVQNNTGTHVSPAKWREMLETEGDKIVIDVRNDYEWEIGHFEGAQLPAHSCFRDFRSYADDLKGKIDTKKTKVMMYCTGGIRCELYSALLKKRGFEEVYQLQGGIIRYGQEEGTKHWKGKLFVFDDRLAVPIDGKENEAISQCHNCAALSDTYYNCANMDCNTLFRCCPDCLPLFKGCCTPKCAEAPRTRPFIRRGNKPFRKKHLY